MSQGSKRARLNQQHAPVNIVSLFVVHLAQPYRADKCERSFLSDFTMPSRTVLIMGINHLLTQALL